MAEPKMRSTRRRCSSDSMPELTPMEKTIAKYLRFQCPTKKGMFMGTQVVYFNGSKAVECLIESKWSSIRTQSTDDDKNPIYFSSKHDAVLVRSNRSISNREKKKKMSVILDASKISRS